MRALALFLSGLGVGRKAAGTRLPAFGALAGRTSLEAMSTGMSVTGLGICVLALNLLLGALLPLAMVLLGGSLSSGGLAVVDSVMGKGEEDGTCPSGLGVPRLWIRTPAMDGLRRGRFGLGVVVGDEKTLMGAWVVFGGGGLLLPLGLGLPSSKGLLATGLGRSGSPS